jgi:thiosulfate/3-mercaptopyruvate sulfurtransferase
MILIVVAGGYLNAQRFDKIFIDAEWLHTRLNQDSLIIIHVDQPENYMKGHIPGALYMNQNAYTAIREGLYFEMPDKVDFSEELRKRGIEEGEKVIISSGWDTFAHAFRLYVTFEYFGLEEQIKILDGGIRGWAALGFKVSQDSMTATSAKNKINLSVNDRILVDKNWIRSNLTNPALGIIDARSENFYTGKEKGNYQRAGHIQGAVNLTWTTLVDDHFVLLEPDSLRHMYRKILGPEQNTLVMYCHVGLRASVLYTVGKALGYNVLLYDGSYNEWDGLDISYPVENE